MQSSRIAKASLLLAFVAQICAFNYFRKDPVVATKVAGSSEVAELRHKYDSQVQNLKATETNIQNLTDEALAILPEWIGTLEGRDSSTRMTKADVAEVCLAIQDKLTAPERCKPYLTRKLPQARDEVIRLWQTRKADLLNAQDRYKALKRDLNQTVQRLKELGAEISA